MPSIVNVYNNVIGRLYAPAASGTDVVRGISCPATTALTSLNITYNTVYLDASSSGANFGSSCLYHASSSTATSGKLFLADNILVNESIPNGTGRSLVFRRGSIVILDNYDNTSNNNLFYPGIPSPNNVIFGDAANSIQTLAAFKLAVAPRETNSATENPIFLSPLGPNGVFLRIDPASSSVSFNAGIPIIGITDDFNGTSRNISTPDMGAYELIDPNCFGSISKHPMTQSVCPGNMVSLEVIADFFPGPPFTYQWFEGLAGDVSTPVGTNSAVFTTPALSVVTTYWVRVSNGCSSENSNAATIGILNSATWTGSIDNNWNNSGNWNSNCVPGAGMDIHIPSGSPTLSGGTSSARNFTIQSGVTLDLSNGALLNVTGNFFNYGTITSGGIPSTGKIILNGTVRQHLGGSGTFPKVEFDNPTSIVIYKPSIISEGIIKTGTVINSASITVK